MPQKTRVGNVRSQSTTDVARRRNRNEKLYKAGARSSVTLAAQNADRRAAVSEIELALSTLSRHSRSAKAVIHLDCRFGTVDLYLADACLNQGEWMARDRRVYSMSRRSFCWASVGIFIAPDIAIAQASKVRRIGVLEPGPPWSPQDERKQDEPLRELGWVEGQNLHIERRYD